MINLPRVLKPESPAFVEEPVAELQDVLAAAFPWLNHVFGLAERMAGKIGKYPGIYAGGGAYINALPDQMRGSTAFFMLDSPQEVKKYAARGSAAPLWECGLSLIVWLDMRDYREQTATDRDKQAVKLDVWRALESAFLKSGRFTPSRFYDWSEQVYKGFDIDEKQSQYLMEPYTSFRIEGILNYRKCNI